MGLRVLVVDDDPLTLRTVLRILESAGHHASELRGGFGFTIALRDARPHVVLLDMNMPGLGGEGALRSARAMADQLEIQPKILLHSGMGEVELRDWAERLAVDGFVRKPCSRAELLEAVERLGDAA